MQNGCFSNPWDSESAIRSHQNSPSRSCGVASFGLGQSAGRGLNWVGTRARRKSNGFTGPPKKHESHGWPEPVPQVKPLVHPVFFVHREPPQPTWPWHAFSLSPWLVHTSKNEATGCGRCTLRISDNVPNTPLIPRGAHFSIGQKGEVMFTTTTAKNMKKGTPARLSSFEKLSASFSPPEKPAGTMF